MIEINYFIVMITFTVMRTVGVTMQLISILSVKMMVVTLLYTTKNTAL